MERGSVRVLIARGYERVDTTHACVATGDRRAPGTRRARLKTRPCAPFFNLLLSHFSPAPFDSLSLAAAAASRARRKARAAARLAPRVGAAGLGVKAFVCGVRWGVRLAPSALASPASLAAALDAALADDGVACGTGNLLGVLMLGRDGRTHAFGTAAGKAGAVGRSGVDAEAGALVAAAESWEGWGAAAATAARLYVSDALMNGGQGAAA